MAGDAENYSSKFVVIPNCSMSWQENKLFIITLAIISFTIGGFFAIQGYWVILPFVGLEILLLTVVLRWCCQETTRREVISIDAENIDIKMTRQRVSKLHRFQSAWTKVVLYPPKYSGHQGRLVVCSKGKEVEVGAFLSNDERQSLAASIKNALENVNGPNCYIRS